MRVDAENDAMLAGWERGQNHLVAGRYSAARGELERAENMAWRRRDARSLARIYLPLLEARRLIRYQAAEGVVIVGAGDGDAGARRRALAEFIESAAGTIFLAGQTNEDAVAMARQVEYAARRTGRWLEALVLLRHGGQTRVASAGDARFSAGLPVRFTENAEGEQIGASTQVDLVVPLPLPGRYENGAPHALARESIVIAWEALALKWQRRHPTRRAKGKEGAWAEMAWLRRALQIDPACEPISMRLIAVAEGIERMTP